MFKPFSYPARVFQQIISTALVLAILTPDPISAANLTHHFAHSNKTFSTVSAAHVYLDQALMERLSAALWKPDMLRTSKTLAAITLMISMIPSLIGAPIHAEQKQKKPEKPKRPPILRIEVPQAPSVEQQNKTLTESAWTGAWHKGADIAEAAQPEKLRRQVIIGSPKMSAMFYKHRAAWQALVAIRRDEGRSSTLSLDKLHAPGVPFVGPWSTIDQAILYPDVAVSHPKQQTQPPNSDADEKDPRKGFWGNWIDGLMKALRGKQWYSKNQVEAEFLREAGQAFEVRKAFSELEQTALESYEDALRTSLGYTAENERLRELRDMVDSLDQRLKREIERAGLESRGPDEILRLRAEHQQAMNALQTAETGLEKIRVHWLKTLAASPDSLSDAVTKSIRPERAAAALPLPTEIPADSPLASSPYQRRLELQSDLLEQVHKQLLELKKEPTWKAGVHVALGTLPFFAGLFNYDRNSPDAAAVRSLDDWILEASLKQKDIASQIVEEQNRVRESYLLARAELQNAQAQITATQNLIDTYEKQRQMALQARNVAADALLPSLEIQRLEHVLLRYTTQAEDAWRLMQIYTVESQEALQRELVQHYVEVIQSIDPTYVPSPELLNPSIPRKPIAQRMIGWIAPAALALVATFAPFLAATVSAHSFTSAAGAAASTAASTAVPVGSTAAKVAMQVTLGKHMGGAENTLWGVAKNVLHAAHPDQARFSAKEIWNTVHQLAKEGGISNPAKVRSGRTYNIGSYDPGTAQRLQAHHDPGMQVAPYHPVAPAHAPIPSAPAAHVPTPEALPAPAAIPAPLASPDSISVSHDTTWVDSWSSGLGELLHHPMIWASHHQLAAILIVGAVGIGLAALITISLRSKGRKGLRNGNGFSLTNGHSRNGLRSPWMMGSLAVTLGLGGLALFIPWAGFIQALDADRNWIQAGAAVFGLASMASLHPALRFGKSRWVLGLAAASSAVWLVTPAPILAFIPLFVAAFGANQYLIKKTPVSRSRRSFLAAVPLAVWAFWPSSKDASSPSASSMVSNGAEQNSLQAIASINNGVSVQTIQIPVRWTPPEDGVVTAVRIRQSTVTGKPLGVAYEPLEASLLRRLRAIRLELTTLEGTDVLSEAGIESSADAHPDALIHVRGDFAGSVDEDISRSLDEIEALLRSYRDEKALSTQTAAVSGEATVSFEEDHVRYVLFEKGLLLNALLVKRDQRNNPIHADFHVFLEKGLILEGTELKKGSPVTLFNQDFPDNRLIQLRLPPADALAFERAWHLSKDQAVLRLADPASSRIIPLPLSQVEEFVREDDPVFEKDLRPESLSGLDATNPATGRDRIIPVHLIVRSRDLASSGYQFRGLVNADGQRLGEASKNFTIGNATIVADNATHPPYPALIEPLQDELTAIQALNRRLAVLEQRVEAYRSKHPESAWVIRFARNLEDERGRLVTLTDQWTREIRNAEESGRLMKGRWIQPMAPFAWNHYPLARLYPNAADRQALIPLGPKVLVSVSFYAQAQNLANGDRVRVHVSGAAQPFEFAISQAGSRSLDRLYDVYHYRAERELTLEEARTFFPSGVPMTRTLVRIELGRREASVSRSNLLNRIFGLAAAGSLLSVDEPPQPPAAAPAFGMPLPVDLYDTREPSAVPELAERREKVVLDEQFVTSLKTTALEYERYWYRGQPRTYLTYRQKVASLWKKKMKLREQMVLQRRFERNGVTRWQVFLLDEFYQAPSKEAAAGSKTRTFFWVLVILGGMAGMWFRSSPDTREEAVTAFLTHPMIAPFFSNPLAGAMSTVIGILVGGWLIINIAEVWGKFIANTWYNVYHKFLLQKVLGSTVRDEFVRQTGRSGTAELKKIYETTVLYPDDKIAYDGFMDPLFGLATQLTDAAHNALVMSDLERSRMDPPSPYGISEKTKTFVNAFRIQLRRSRYQKLPIYPAVPRPLASDEELFRKLKVERGFDAGTESKDAQYQALEWARAEEAKSLMRQFPMHTLMALLRSGTAEYIVDLEQLDQSGLIRKSLNALKERLPTLDEDAFGGFRAQERAGEVFDLLHYVFEGLHDTYWRERIVQYWEPTITAYELNTWKSFLIKLPALLSTMDAVGRPKQKAQLTSDHNIVRTIAYALTLRGSKERIEASKELLTDLRRWRSHSPEVVMQDEYLRDDQGQPTTSVQQLKRAYEKGYDLLSELIGWFPGEAILGDRDIYLTCENIVNFRQALREVGFWLQLTRGRVVILDVGNADPNFFAFLQENLPGRVSTENANRIGFMKLEEMETSHKLMRDRKAIIISSATPNDWVFLKMSAGTRIHVPSEVLSPMAALLVLRDVSDIPVCDLIAKKQKALMDRFESIRDRHTLLKKILGRKWYKLEKRGVQFGTQPAPGRLPYRLQWIKKMLNRGLPLKKFEIGEEKERDEDNQIRSAQKEISRQYYELERLKREMNNLDRTLADIGIKTANFTDGDRQTLPEVPIKEVLTGKYRLDTLFTVNPIPDNSSTETVDAVPSRVYTPGNRAGIRFPRGQKNRAERRILTSA